MTAPSRNRSSRRGGATAIIGDRRMHACGSMFLLLLVTVARPVAGQPDQVRDAPFDRTLPAILQRPTTLREGIGQAHESIGTSSERARAYYNQGLAYLHSFVWIEAARSFNDALRIDNNLAMAYVGLSYALGELGESAGARQASRRAQALAQGVGARDQLRINLRVKQLDAAGRPEDQSLQAAYRTELDIAIATFPRDVELLLLVGQAQERTHSAHGMGAGAGAVPFYQRALTERPDYFAIHHYLIHAYENSNRLERALEHAAAYVRMAAAIPHAHHMYGHVLGRMGRAKEAIAAFRTADALDSDYLRTENIPQEYNWHYRHNLDLLGGSYAYTGQLKLAERFLRQSFQLESIGAATEELNRKAWPIFLLGHGRSKEALTAVNALMGRRAPLIQALGRILHSRALMALNQRQAAAEEGNVALKQMRAVGPIGGILLPDFELAQGEYLLRTGETETGRVLLRDAAAKLRAATGADAWIQTLFALEGVARAAREVNDWTLAAEMSEHLREHDPEYAGTHYALGLVAERRGDIAIARAEYAEAIRRWQDADADFSDLTDTHRRRAAVEAVRD